jgi:hypothetical protein
LSKMQDIFFSLWSEKNLSGLISLQRMAQIGA